MVVLITKRTPRVLLHKQWLLLLQSARLEFYYTNNGCSYYKAHAYSSTTQTMVALITKRTPRVLLHKQWLLLLQHTRLEFYRTNNYCYYNTHALSSTARTIIATTTRTH